MIDLTSVEYALSVAEHLSFRRAAKALGIRQSAVSRRIQALEDGLGVSLFERHSSGVRLTAAGESFLSGASDALGELRFAVRRAEEAGRGARGFLRLGLSSSLASGAVHDILQRYRVQHPDVVLHFVEGSTRDHVARVNERGLDLAFVCGFPSTPDCDRLLLGMERLYATLPTGHALSNLQVLGWDSLVDERFIARQEDIAPDFLTAARIRSGRGSESASVERLNVGRDSLMHLVSMGFGLVLSTASAITVPFPGIVFRPIEPPDNEIALSALWLSGNDNPALRRFVSMARTFARPPTG